MSQWIRNSTRERIYQRDHFTCVYCQASVYDTVGIELTLDHVEPQVFGGGNETENLVTACRPCNCSRQDRSVKKFAQILADQGVDPKGVARRVRNAQRRKLPKLMKKLEK